ncbi:epsin-3-like isoform X2 [Protopterus annectens]|uniref:epsin-3-like isoform X2 n=1 Tax=Protopterus annectens TaxID=7888 RepID=UPI001CFA61AA|nr:epsin-3-like isoform X2 [Protopterus annectens]
MTTSALRRQMKNVVHNYTDAEIKVREATSNDPWGPPTTLMSEISDMTFNTCTLTEVMGMIWKRLNDHGKNWRHVYKALMLLDYLIKTGSDKVAQQCKENIYAIQTLKEFQYIDKDGRDQGINVREKAKQLVNLLKDEERLREERANAQKTKERMCSISSRTSASHKDAFPRASSQPTLYSAYADDCTRSRGSPSSYKSSSSSPRLAADLEQARPQTSGEEELHLQLALAMSREEAEKISSKKSPTLLEKDAPTLLAKAMKARQEEKLPSTSQSEKSALVDLLDVFVADPTAPPPSGMRNTTNGTDAVSDPWRNGRATSPTFADPWNTTGTLLTTKAQQETVSWLNTNDWAMSTSTSGQCFEAIQNKRSSPQPSKVALESWSPIKTYADPWGKISSDPTQSLADPWSKSAEKSLQSGTADSAMFDHYAQLGDRTEKDFPERSSTPPRWLTVESSSPVELDFAVERATIPRQNGSRSLDFFDLSGLDQELGDFQRNRRNCRTPESFLDASAAKLVNLESLIPQEPQRRNTKNPFLTGLSTPSPNNPFNTADPSKVTLDQMRKTSSTPQPIVPSSNVMDAPSFFTPYSSSLPLPLSSLPFAQAVPTSVNAQTVGKIEPRGATAALGMPVNLPPPLLPFSPDISHTQGSQNPFL